MFPIRRNGRGRNHSQKPSSRGEITVPVIIEATKNKSKQKAVFLGVYYIYLTDSKNRSHINCPLALMFLLLFFASILPWLYEKGNRAIPDLWRMRQAKRGEADGRASGYITCGMSHLFGNGLTRLFLVFIFSLYHLLMSSNGTERNQLVDVNAFFPFLLVSSRFIFFFLICTMRLVDWNGYSFSTTTPVRGSVVLFLAEE